MTITLGIGSILLFLQPGLDLEVNGAVSGHHILFAYQVDEYDGVPVQVNPTNIEGILSTIRVNPFMALVR